jgi:hypothetical protein
MNLTNRNVLTLMVAAAAIVTSAGLGIADTRSNADRQILAATGMPAESFVYFPSQYLLDASGPPSEHIEAY